MQIQRKKLKIENVKKKRQEREVVTLKQLFGLEGYRRHQSKNKETHLNLSNSLESF